MKFKHPMFAIKHVYQMVKYKKKLKKEKKAESDV